MRRARATHPPLWSIACNAGRPCFQGAGPQLRHYHDSSAPVANRLHAGAGASRCRLRPGCPAQRQGVPAPQDTGAAERSPFRTRPMNQLVRMSQIGEAENIQEPSAELRVPFAQSGAFVCKYIIGEPSDQAICCGAPVQDGKSWCAFHRRIVFEPARPGRVR
ncbi:GcrA family cell cycle regulator [Methylobacterium komagatae]